MRPRVILAHNHPSGVAEPSQADRALTRGLTEALALVDVRVLDHFIVAGTAPSPLSFAERGLLASCDMNRRIVGYNCTALLKSSNSGAASWLAFVT